MLSYVFQSQYKTALQELEKKSETDLQIAREKIIATEGQSEINGSMMRSGHDASKRSLGVMARGQCRP